MDPAKNEIASFAKKSEKLKAGPAVIARHVIQQGCPGGARTAPRTRVQGLALAPVSALLQKRGQARLLTSG
jgi:hypothetical protein